MRVACLTSRHKSNFVSAVLTQHKRLCRHATLDSSKDALKRNMLVQEELPCVQTLFDEMAVLDVVTATDMIGRFARQDKPHKAVELLSKMLSFGVKPNGFTLCTLFPICRSLGDLKFGMQLHTFSSKLGFVGTVFVGSAILNLYVNLGSKREVQRAFDDIEVPNIVSYTTLICWYLKMHSLADALSLFRELPEKNAVSWNAMIGGCSRVGLNEPAVNLCVEMLRDGFLPDQWSFPCAIIAAANIAALGTGRSFHACALKSLGSSNEYVANSLISFYAKCGRIGESLLVFNKLGDKSTVSWNAIICGFAQNGRAKDAVAFYEKMKTAGIRPNSVTLLGVLWACNHAGLVDIGYSYFNVAKLGCSDLLQSEHYACMVDLLARCGRLREARQFLNCLPFEPGIGFWKSLLGGCQIHSNSELGELAAKKIFDLDPGDTSSYVMLFNAHSAAGRWRDASIVRREMKDKEHSSTRMENGADGNFAHCHVTQVCE